MFFESNLFLNFFRSFRIVRRGEVNNPLFFADYDISAFAAQAESRDFFTRMLHHQQCALFGKTLYIEPEGRIFWNARAGQQAVVEVDRKRIPAETRRQFDVVSFGIRSSVLLVVLHFHAHVDENDDDCNDRECQYSVTDHELFIGVERIFCHKNVYRKLIYSCKTNIFFANSLQNACIFYIFVADWMKGEGRLSPFFVLNNE